MTAEVAQGHGAPLAWLQERAGARNREALSAKSEKAPVIEPELLSQHIGEIYDAALDPTAWTRVIEATGRLTRTCAGTLASLDVLRPATWAANITFGYDPTLLEAFNDKYARLSPANKFILQQPLGEPGAVSRVMRYEDFTESIMYKEWAQPQGLVDSIGLNIEKSATALVHLGLARHESVGITDEACIETLKLLYPHYRRSVVIGRVVDLAKVEATAIADTLDGLAAGVFLVDREMRLVHTNRAGEGMLRQGAAVHKAWDSLSSSDGTAARALRGTCAAISRDSALGEQGVSVAIRGRDREPYVAHVLPLTSGARERGGRFYGAVAAVFVRSARLERPSALDAMAQLYGLTPAEIKMLVGIVELGGVPAVAQANGVSQNTVKSHLKQVFDKTGASRQADLVKLMAGIISPLAQS